MNHFFAKDTNVMELMEQRHSVRRYTDKFISDKKAKQLQECIDACNAESGLSIYLVRNEPKAFSNIAAHYGHFEGVGNYLVIAGPDAPEYDEKAGYYCQELVLLAQEMGLRTCWVALTFSKRHVRKGLPAGTKLWYVISLGYGETDGRAHKTRSPQDLSNITEESPAWFKQGVRGAMLAPTAINQQSFYIALSEDQKTVSIVAKGGPCCQCDLGIVKHDFELAAGKQNFTWA